MDRQEAGNNFQCSMCFFQCVLYNELMRHYVKMHQHDPQFRVQCTQYGCGAIFTKWRSFRTHLFRKHPEVPAIVDDVNEDAAEEAERDVGNINEIQMEEDDENENEELIPGRALEHLQLQATQFILNIRENCKVSHNSINHIIDGVENLVDVYSAKIIEALRNKSNPETLLLNFEDAKDVYSRDHPSSSLFSSLRSKKYLDKVLVEQFGMVLAKGHVIGHDLKWKKKKERGRVVCEIRDISCEAQIVPLLDNLKNLLRNKHIQSNIENPKPHEEGVFRTVLDGSYYRENAFFRSHKNALAIILYYDDLGIVNPLGSASKTHKMSMFYWTLANIYPEYRSTQNAVQLYAIVKTEYLKKPDALQNILQPFISDIKTLQADGIDINVNGVVKNFKGSLLFCAEDTPAAAMLGGFKESVSAHRLCRSCMATREEWKENFRETNFTLRNIIEHEQHIEIIADPSISQAASQFWRRRYGVNSRSPLMEITDVTKCLPQDAMHILIEGPVQITCKLFLRYCIFELQLFTIDDFNNRLASFDFGHFKNDKPAPIQREHLADDGSLRQTAGQMLTLAHTLLFLIGEWIIPCENQELDEHIYAFVTLLQIMNVSLAYEIHDESVDCLGRMIEVFIRSFKTLYPDCIVPKFHFLTHLLQYIRLFGPARQQWCFRFEATHAYFKGLVPVVRNFKNMALTLSYRHQARLCSRLAPCPGMPSKRFLYVGDYVTPGQTVLLRNLPYARIFNGMIDENDWLTCQMMRSAKIVIHGTTYHQNSIVLLNCSNEDDLPVFGKVLEIFILGHTKLLVILTLETLHFESKLNSYNVRKSAVAGRNIRVHNVKNLIFPHPLSSFIVMNRKYVSLINHERVEFC